MNLKLQWMSQGEKINEPALAFCFVSSQYLFNGINNLVTYWLKAGDNLPAQNNLVVTGFGEVTQVRPDITKWRKGELEDGTARDVYPLLNSHQLPFRAGLTLHATRGTWSSLPHEFEREEILLPRPMPFYEKFAYVTQEPGGWGIQTRIGHIYRADAEEFVWDWPKFINDKITVRDRDILDIPLGSHPFSAGPQVLAGYFWIFWGGNLENRQKFTKDKAL